MISNYYFNVDSKSLTYDLSALILKHFGKKMPIIICLGSDKLLSDMVGVFVADKLKSINLRTFIFGGSDRCVNKTMAKVLINKINNRILNHKVLFIDSAMLSDENTIMFSNITKLNDGTIINAPSINCGTIIKKNNKIFLNSITYNKVMRYSKLVTEAICDYFSYLQLIKTHN